MLNITFLCIILFELVMVNALLKSMIINLKYVTLDCYELNFLENSLRFRFGFHFDNDQYLIANHFIVKRIFRDNSFQLIDRIKIAQHNLKTKEFYESMVQHNAILVTADQIITFETNQKEADKIFDQFEVDFHTIESSQPYWPYLDRFYFYLNKNLNDGRTTFDRYATSRQFDQTVLKTYTNSSTKKYETIENRLPKLSLRLDGVLFERIKFENETTYYKLIEFFNRQALSRESNMPLDSEQSIDEHIHRTFQTHFSLLQCFKSLCEGSRVRGLLTLIDDENEMRHVIFVENRYKIIDRIDIFENDSAIIDTKGYLELNRLPNLPKDRMVNAQRYYVRNVLINDGLFGLIVIGEMVYELKIVANKLEFLFQKNLKLTEDMNWGQYLSTYSVREDSFLVIYPHNRFFKPNELDNNLALFSEYTIGRFKVFPKIRKTNKHIQKRTPIYSGEYHKKFQGLDSFYLAKLIAITYYNKNSITITFFSSSISFNLNIDSSHLKTLIDLNTTYPLNGKHVQILNSTFMQCFYDYEEKVLKGQVMMDDEKDIELIIWPFHLTISISKYFTFFILFIYLVKFKQNRTAIIESLRSTFSNLNLVNKKSKTRLSKASISEDINPTKRSISLSSKSSIPVDINLNKRSISLSSKGSIPVDINLDKKSKSHSSKGSISMNIEFEKK